MQSAGIGVNTLLLLLIVVAAVGVVIAMIVRAGRRKSNTGQPSWPRADAPGPQLSQPVRAAAGYGKRCPTCRSIYTDETLAFCLSDGSTLERVANRSGSNDPGATYVYPTADRGNVAPTVQYHPNGPEDRKR